MNKTIAYTTVATIVDASVVPGDLILAIVNQADGTVVSSQVVDEQADHVDVDIAASGTYTAHLKRVDAAGAIIGNLVVSDPITVDIAPATITVNTAATVAFAA